jgi:ribokinase
VGKVAVLGSINKDLIAVCERHPDRGETVRGLGLLPVPGGKGSNQTLAAKYAGGEVTLIGAVGDDAEGHELLNFLNRHEINTDHVRLDEVPTGKASIFVDLEGEISIVAFPGANEKVKDDPSVELFPGDICVSQLEVPLSSIEAFFTRGRQRKCTNILNASPYINIPDELAELTDFCILNQRELTALAGISIADLSTHEHVAALIQSLPISTHATVLLLEPDNSVLAVSANGVEMFPGATVNVVDYTGVEDCFIGSFASMLAASSSLEKAIQYASQAAAIASKMRGSMMPTRKEVEDNIVFERLRVF